MTNEFFRSFKAIIIAIALTIITAIVGWIFVTNTLSLKKTPINISDTSFDWSSLKAGDHVVGDIQYSPGYFMYTQRSGGYEESRDYVITDYAKLDGEYSYYYMMSTKVYNGDFDRWESLANPSDGKTIHIEGVLKKINSQQKSYLEHTLRDAGFSSEEINSAVIPLMVFQTNKNNNLIFLIIMVACGLIVIAFWFGIIKAFRTKEDYSDDYLSRDDAISRYYGNNSATDNEAYNQFSGYTSGKTLSAPSEQEAGGEEQPKFWVKK